MDEYTYKIRRLGDKLVQNYKCNNCKIYNGINGPYDDPETKVRNLSHLIIITAIEILKFNKKTYIKDLKLMGSELISLQSSDGIYIMRNKEGKDFCNGVIGHAWVIEAYVYLFKVFKENHYITVAEKLCEKHYFNRSLCLWERPISNKNEEDIDYTLNHQLWYAASLAELNFYLKNEYFEKQLIEFLNKLQVNMSVGMHGKISHSIYNRTSILNKTKNNIKKIINNFNEIMNRPSLQYKEQGYHIFNMMALARLYQLFPEHVFFKSIKFNKTLKYCNTSELLIGLKNPKISLDKSLNNKIINQEEKDLNIYGYPYNVPGFEIMFCKCVFRNKINDQIVNKVMNEQFLLTFDQDTGFFDLKCHDKYTINYRIYEYYRYLEIEN